MCFEIIKGTGSRYLMDLGGRWLDPKIWKWKLINWSQLCRFGFSYLDKVFHINIHWPHFISLFLSISSPQFPMCSGQGTWTGHKDAGDKITPTYQPRTDSAINQLSVSHSRLFTKIIFTSDGKLYWFQENLYRAVWIVNNHQSVSARLWEIIRSLKWSRNVQLARSVGLDLKT